MMINDLLMTDYYTCYVKWLSQPDFEPAGVWDADIPSICSAWKTRGSRNNMFWNARGDVEAIRIIAYDNTETGTGPYITLNQRDMRVMSRQ